MKRRDSCTERDLKDDWYVYQRECVGEMVLPKWRYKLQWKIVLCLEKGDMSELYISMQDKDICKTIAEPKR